MEIIFTPEMGDLINIAIITVLFSITFAYSFTFTFTFSHLADAFIQSDLQMRTIEAIKINKRATTCKCYDKSRLA